MSHKNRLFSLDFIRVFSVALVVFFHFGMFVNQYGIYWCPFPVQAGSVYYGSIGVSLFFILSGATLTYSGHQKAFSLRRYYKKRFLTLFPSFYLAYAAAFLYLFYRSGVITPQAPKWTFLFTLLGLDGHLTRLVPNYYLVGEWFLGTIILLYLFYPLLAWAMKRWKTKALAAIGICYVALVYVYRFEGIPVEWNAAVRIPEMAFGIYFMNRYLEHKAPATPSLFSALCALAVFLLALLFPVPGYMIYNITAAGISAFLLLFYLGTLLHSRRLSMMVSWVSRYSYGIFLCHHIMLQQVCIRWQDRAFSTTELFCLLLVTIASIAFGAYWITKEGQCLANFIAPPYAPSVAAVQDGPSSHRLEPFPSVKK